MDAEKFIINNKPNINVSCLIEAYGFLIDAYNILKSEIKDFSKFNENKIRDKLVEKSENMKGKHNYFWNTEHPNLKKSNRIDIQLITPYSLKDKDKTIEIECKIIGENKYIDTRKSFNNKKSPTNGIMSFITGKYSEKMNISGMIGFMKKGDIEDKIKKIKSRISSHKDIVTVQNLKTYKINNSFDYSYTSNHKRNKKLGNIDIYHLFFDFT